MVKQWSKMGRNEICCSGFKIYNSFFSTSFRLLKLRSPRLKRPARAPVARAVLPGSRLSAPRFRVPCTARRSPSTRSWSQGTSLGEQGSAQGNVARAAVKASRVWRSRTGRIGARRKACREVWRY